ncbi:rhamnogalacturonan acetylesterase [Bifidobacterium sp. 82T10]|uniref:Rhamnogalacturonan acetylesterase n=1 Tax=Bifidobacterium miconis TaxID=2834435 RepID=A0ABS6WEE0_9BIFI|nr:rhamnogalacturonan acetylesterase [Bifidobacterium miconis]MBW3092408.1 rhamnogalacturonan acetylesterase [Bifidobacterium miconis]
MIRVADDDEYDATRGYGWLGERARRCEPSLSNAEIAGGFEPGDHTSGQRPYAQAAPTVSSDDPPVPRSFAVRVPADGNYRLSLTLDAARMTAGIDETIVAYVQERRLVYRGPVPPDGHLPDIVANVGAFVPDAIGKSVDHRLLVVTVVARRPIVASLDVRDANVPTLYLAGDSTVTDTTAHLPLRFGRSHTGWGASLPAFLDAGVAVANHARSGLSTTMFRNDGHYDPVLREMRAGDVLLLQFGHNDQKDPLLRADGGYTDQLVQFVREARDAGAYPLLVTPLARNTWTPDGTYADLLADFANACITLGRRLDVPVLDLHRVSMAFITAIGVEGVKPYFRPGDVTHTNEFGSYLVAGAVARLIAHVCSDPSLPRAYRDLAAHVTAGFGPWSPSDEPAAALASIRRPSAASIASAAAGSPTESTAPTSGLAGTSSSAPSEIDTSEDSDATSTHVDQFLRPYDPLADATNGDDADAVLTRDHAIAIATSVAGLVPVYYYDGGLADVDAGNPYATQLQSALMNGLIPSSMLSDDGGRCDGNGDDEHGDRTAATGNAVSDGERSHASMQASETTASTMGRPSLHPSEPVDLEEMLVLAVRVWLTKHVAGPLPAGPYDNVCTPANRRSIRLACMLGLLSPDGSADLRSPVTARTAADLLRRLRV